MTTRINDITFEHDDDRYAYGGQGTTEVEVREVLSKDVEVKQRDDSGAILIRFLTDGHLNTVVIDVQSDPTTALDYAIDVLTRARDGVVQIPGQEVGKCLARGDWGQCSAPRDHAAGDHAFPPAVAR